MRSLRLIQQRSGIALPTVLVVMVVVGSVAAAAAVMGSSSFVMAMHDERMGAMVAAADAGLEFGRARLNGDRTLYPDSNFVTLENGAAVRDNAGAILPGLTRWTYAGPIGITTGQYGVFGSVVSVVQNGNGDRIIRRLEVIQESFAKYAYFTDFDYSTGIVFGGGDVILGPAHSNDNIRIHWTGATFQQRLSTAGQIFDRPYGTYNGPVIENAPAIPMPQTTDLNRLRNFAIAGGTRIIGDNNGNAGAATTRIEFFAIDLNGDTDTSDPDEGFFRVYQASTDANYVTAIRPGTFWNSDNCGDWHGSTFVRAPSHPSGGHNAYESLDRSDSRCYLGGSDSLFNTFSAGGGPGSWRAWTGTVDPRLGPSGVNRPDAAYLWPLSRNINPNFKGVIFVDGKVVISGTLRGRVTLAATNEIILGDDLRYVTNPGTVSCDDILGIFSGTDVVIADNTINSPVNHDSFWRTYESGTPDEWLDGVVLALSEFKAQNHGASQNNNQPCDGSGWARGCLRLSGGVIQRVRGAVGTSGGTGYVKRYDYDQCAASDPPPYFPTTGIFARGRYFEVDPRGFNVANYFATLTP